MKNKIFLVINFILKNWFKLFLLCILLSIAISLSDIANHGIIVDGEIHTTGSIDGNVKVEGSVNGYPIEIRQE